MPDPVRFAVAGLEHPHVFQLTSSLMSAGAELVGFHSGNPKPARLFTRLFPGVTEFPDREAIIGDPAVDLVAVVDVPDERPVISCTAMREGKDVISDKPAATTIGALDDVQRVQSETGRIWTLYLSERLESRGTRRAEALVRAGAIGDVVHVIGLGPHRLDAEGRPEWFFDPERSAGILGDLATHQIDQFLCFAGSSNAEIESASVGNHAHPEYPDFADFGEVHLRSANAGGYVRVDWLSPDGLGTWGDVRLFVVGTAGYIEVRKNCDLGGRPGGDHVLLVDATSTRRFDAQRDDLLFARQLLADVRDRTTSAVEPEHCFTVCRLALTAEAVAERRGNLARTR